MRLLRIFAMTIALAVPVLLHGQELDGEYYPFYYQEEHYPSLEIDSSLFYLPVTGDDALFDDLTRYSFSAIRYQRRGERSFSGYEMDGITIDWRDASTLKRLLRSEHAADGLYLPAAPDGGFAGCRRFNSADADGLQRTSMAVATTDRNWRGMVRFYDARALGKAWHLALSLSMQGGDDARIDGVFSRNIELAAILSKQWERWRMALTLAAAPSQRGMRSYSSQETFALRGNNLYNPSWGVENGRLRNSRIRRETLPFAMLRIERNDEAPFRPFATFYAKYGETAVSGLNWYDASTPAPDNYRLLPSYFDRQDIVDRLTGIWRSGNLHYTQIDWDELRIRNSMAGGEAVYIVEDRVERPLTLRGAVGGELRAARNTTLRFEITGELRRSEYFKRLRDLLDAEYLRDIDQYLIDDDRYGNSLVNDLRNPDRIVREGDRFGYHYLTVESDLGAGVELRYRDNRLNLTALARAAYSSAFRDGLYEKQLFPGEGSFGRSATVDGISYNFGIAASYAIAASHRVGISAAATRSMSEIDNLLLQPAYNNRLSDLRPMPVRYLAEAGYLYRGARVGVSVKAFAAIERNRQEIIRFFDDLTYLYSDGVVSGIGTLRYGVEAAVAVPLSQRVSIDAAFTAGSYRYDTNPRMDIYSDADNTLLTRQAVCYMHGLRLADVPSIAAVGRLSYSSPSGWNVSASANYAGGRYVSPTPLRRMQRFTDLAASPEEFEEMIAQKRLDDILTVDLSVMKSWPVNHGRSYLTVMLSVRNLLNDRDMIYSGYEPSRIVRQGSDINIHYRPLPERYLYAYPVSGFLYITYKFR